MGLKKVENVKDSKWEGNSRISTHSTLHIPTTLTHNTEPKNTNNKISTPTITVSKNFTSQNTIKRTFSTTCQNTTMKHPM